MTTDINRTGLVWPTSDQQALMNQTFSVTNVNESGVNGVIGMFGQNDNYYFYMQFEAENSDEWWDGSIMTKNFRILF